MEDLFDALAAQDTSRCIVVSDPPSGLRAFIVVDDTTLGPAVGGVRTKRYSGARDALEEAALLARTMTLKASIAGLDAGGGKIVVMEHPGLDRPRAFERLGQRIDELGGLFRAKSGLGTHQVDFTAIAQHTGFVDADIEASCAAVARGLVGCIEVCAAERGRSLRGLRVAIQGAGHVGRAVAGALREQGCSLIVADADIDRARELAAAVNGEPCSLAGVLLAEVDVVAPCAQSTVIDVPTAQRLRAWAVCGAANNQLADPQAADILAARNVLHVPDLVASAGGLIRALTLEVPAQTQALLAGLAQTTRELFAEARSTRKTTQRLAEARAWQRIRGPR